MTKWHKIIENWQLTIDNWRNSDACRDATGLKVIKVALKRWHGMTFGLSALNGTEWQRTLKSAWWQGAFAIHCHSLPLTFGLPPLHLVKVCKHPLPSVWCRFSECNERMPSLLRHKKKATLRRVFYGGWSQWPIAYEIKSQTAQVCRHTPSNTWIVDISPNSHEGHRWLEVSLFP